MNKLVSLRVSRLVCSRNNQMLFLPVSFILNPGELLHIKGTNGVGKTTLLRCLAGLSKPLSGNISWQERGVKYNVLEKSLVYLGHKIAIKSSLTAYENLQWASLLRAKPSVQQLNFALVQLGLEDKRNTLASALSSGQRQRLALAKLCLAPIAMPWLLDEPFVSLDQQGLILIQRLISNHLNSGGSVILTSHQDITHYFSTYSELELTPLNDHNH